MAETDQQQQQLTTGEHTLIDLHEALKRIARLEAALAAVPRIEAALNRMEGALLKYEPLAAAALRLQDTARMRLLGKGGGRRASKTGDSATG